MLFQMRFRMLFTLLLSLIVPAGSASADMRFIFENCYKKLVARAGIAPKGARPGLAYAISKHFVIWFAKTDAARFGTKNVRCLSMTPGNFDTPMGALESEQADVFKKHSALKRNGRPEEIAALFTLLLDERLGFLTGADIIMDGGVVASGATAE